MSDIYYCARLDEMKTEIPALLADMRRGVEQPHFAETSGLADAALKRLDERKGEDIDEWAKRLAADVADAGD